jgi:hypothetical protein
LATVAFREAYFHKTKGREALNKSHDLNTIDDNMELRAPHQLNMRRNLIFLFLKFL